jgi:PKD repeat protein
MKYLKMMSLVMLTVMFVNCSKDEAVPPMADFQFVVDGVEVTFNGNATNATTFTWDFGDGNTSSEEDPVHTYANPGDYEVTFTVEGEGGSDSEIKIVTAVETVEYLLTGGAENTTGKTWVLNTCVGGKDGLGGVINTLTIDLPLEEGDELLNWIDLGQGYSDTYTFYHDGSYKVDNSDTHGGSLVSMIYANVSGFFNLTPITEGGDIVGISTQPDLAPLFDLVYTPNTDATWMLNEDNFTVNAINPNDGTSYSETFIGKKQLVLTEYIGFKEYETFVVLKEITETDMHVAIGLHGAEGDPTKPTHLIHLSFVAK